MDDNYNNNEYNNGFNNVNLENNKDRDSAQFFKGLISGVLCAAVIFVVAGLIFLRPLITSTTTVNTATQSYDNYEEFVESVATKVSIMEKYLNKDFYYEHEGSFEELADSIYKAYMNSLGDDYAYYYDSEEYLELTQQSSGTYCGIGAVVQQDVETGYIKIVNPYENGPAFEAGVRANDYIIAIEGESIVGMDINSAVALMKGEEGTIVNVTVLRNDEEKSFDIERRIIEIQTVEYEMLEDNIGYVAVSSFEGKTAEHFQKAVDSLIEDGAKGIVVDLRDNGGGLLSAVVAMLDYLLPEGVLVYTEDADGNKIYERSGASCVDIEMAVLINGNSASASEVFTGAMQDYEKAVIVGETSFGKGIVQTVRDLGDGTAIKYTTSGYFTPNGRNIHGTGIEPDIEVELPTDEEAYEDGVLKREYDTQLQEAIKVLTE